MNRFGLSAEQLAAIEAAGYAIVPIEPTERMLRAKDHEGEIIWGGGVEHYFRNDGEAHWYGRLVWRAMVAAGTRRSE